MARSRPTIGPLRPQVQPLELVELSAGDALDLEPNADLEGFEFTDLSLDDVELRAATLFQSRVSGLSADQADVRGIRLHEVELDRLNIPVWKGARSDWRDVVVQGGRLGSAELYESTLRSVTFTGVKISYLTLRGASLQDVLFTDCVIDELDLGGAKVSRVSVEGTKVGRLDVQQAQISNLDLRAADLAEIVGLSALRGATISELQLTQLAPAFAASLGIQIA